MIARERLESVVGNPSFELLEVDEAEQGIAADEVMVEKGQWLARVITLQPERGAG